MVNVSPRESILHRSFSTTKLSDYYTLEVQQKFIIQSVIDFERDEGYAFGVLTANGKRILAK